MNIKTERAHDSRYVSRRDSIRDLVLSAPITYRPDEVEAIITEADRRLDCMEDGGLRATYHPNGALRGFMLTTLASSPYAVERHIYGTLRENVYINPDYYGTKDDPKVINHRFSEADLGSVFFVVEASNVQRMPKHRLDSPGSLCVNMPFGKDNDTAFSRFSYEFSRNTKILAVNYLAQALIHAHDLRRGLISSTINTVNYIQQPYKIASELCPCGLVNDGALRYEAVVRYSYNNASAVCIAR